MEKMKMRTTDLAEEKYQKLIQLFPDIITETIVTDENGKEEVIRAIDKDKLEEEISTHVLEKREERYEFTWPEKRKAIYAANEPINKTLRPCKEESVNFDTTENLYIEGDNLEALKLLHETYLNKIKMIYIDPPYNTGNDFVYRDNFNQDSEDYKKNSGQLDEEGNRLKTNLETDGRYHTNWLNMMYPRLKIARDLLSEDGVIFISIDDNEQSNLEKICNEIFGENNFVANVVWKHTQQSKNDERYFSRQYNYTLVFAKNKLFLKDFYFNRTKEDNKNYSNKDNDINGLWRKGDVRSPSYRKTLCYKIIAPNGNIIEPPINGWRWSEKSFKQKIDCGEIIFNKENSGIIRKIYLAKQKGRTPENLWEEKEGNKKFGTTRNATAELKGLFDGKQIFDTPKPKELIMRMLEITNSNDSIILDFFSGSSTTAHAVMQFNAEDSGKRKFIMVQIPELTDSKSEAYKAGYKNICEIGKERIRRAGKELIKSQTKEANDLFNDQSYSLDIGFRVLKVDSTNMKDVYYKPQEYREELFDSLEENIKLDRTDEDLLFQSLIDLGIDLSSKISEFCIADKKIYSVDNDFLLACFEPNISEEVIRVIAKRTPSYALFKNSSIENDSLAANFDQIFNSYSKDTIRKVL